MVKSKKGKKEIVVDENGDSDIDMEATHESEDETRQKGKPKKKDKKKVTKKNSCTDEELDLVEAGVQELKLGKKQKKGKKTKAGDNEDDEDQPKVGKEKKGGFNLLMADLSDDDDVEIKQAVTDNDEDNEEDVRPVKKAAEKGGKKSKKSKKKKNDSDEDIDKVLADLEKEYAGEKSVEPKVEAKVSDVAGVGENDQDDQAPGTVKSAAQKKKEKKERQKREAALLKQQQDNNEIDSSTVVEAPAKKETKSKKVKEEKPIEQPEDDNNQENDEEVDKKDDKRKKKKGKVDKEEKDKDKDKGKKKGVSSAMVAAMQERLAKVREEEERLKREEEERLRREEELENLRLENIRLEAERKEKKKQREQERKARLKAEGKLLTAKQKLDKARAQAMLENLRAQGVDVPEVGEKRPRPGTRIRPNKKKDQLQRSESQDDQVKDETEVQATVDDVPETDEKKEEVEVVEKIKDSWDASSSSSEDESKEPKKEEIVAKVESEGEDEDDESDDEDEDNSDSDDSSSSDGKTTAEDKREKVWERIQKRRHAAEQKRTLDHLRAAVVCVLGHVDTGKTKILDKLRRTNVQDGEAGGITQQIGATNVPIEAIKEQTRIVKGFSDMTFRLPGLLIIDTPGHESFSNLRNRGSSLCDIAILVVDIMHGLEPQTIESLNLLKDKKVPFVVALNKIDRLYNWQTHIRKDVRDSLNNQVPGTQIEFQKRTKETIVQFAEQGLNAALFYENPDPTDYINLVPTSAITGEGMGNLLFMIVDMCQNMLAKRLMYSEELLATVLEVKAIPGLGTTIDAILINGKLKEGETMCIAGTDGPIVTQIRSLLMPQPMKELRVKNAYIEYREIVAAQGVKIAAKELEKAIAGLNLYVAQKPDEVDFCREEVAKELKSALSHIKLSQEGVYVQASTLGSLEALLEFLRTSKIPTPNAAHFLPLTFLRYFH
ncbi:Eukaryotic translation initiation factor 5B [Pseudolycoriella hygida]|uniref:Eukaryotic translation initiation factor 5B n=1 Tax=Pseudolycoriella hygida TaxID=35572 RepID=A0A9Q0N1E6_9DIPT|nr:Eukaryotic translation initiation factor 5B [Pseudolycoriella hygida]